MDINSKNMWSLIGFIEASSSRRKILIAMDYEEYKKPSDLVKESKLTSSQVSLALKDLKNKNLVVCLNENANKGRLYIITDLGKDVAEKLKNKSVKQ